MVDINLFKDDDEEEKEEEKGKKEKNARDDSQEDKEDLGGDFDEKLSFNDEEKLGGDFNKNQNMDLDLDDEFEDGLDEDTGSDIDKDIDSELDDVSSLDDEEFLDDELDNEEEIPDLEGPAKDSKDEDYTYGEVKKKGVSPFLLILLGIVVIVALGYQFVYKPKVEALRDIQNNIPEKPDIEELIEQQRKQLAAGKKDTTSSTGVTAPDSEKQPVKPGETTEKVSAPGTAIQTTELAKNTGSLINYFSQNNCLGTIIIDIKDKYFRAGYASLQPNVSGEMAEKIKTIFNTGKYETSPEDGFRTNGEMRYWGVISGELPGSVISQPVSAKNFNSAQLLQQWLQRTAQNNSLVFKDSKTFPANTQSGETTIPVRINVEGNSNNLITYLTILLRNSGKYSVDKMIITPVNVKDFKGETIKFVIDLTLRS